MATPSSTNDPPGEKTFFLAESANNNSSAGATAVVALPTTTTTLKAPPLPTYASSEQSEYYQTAKNLLHAGDFENALLCLEEGFEFTKRVLQESAVVDADLHESMAPFHYLYGTTLLYSVEESADPQQAMMNNTGTTTSDNHKNDTAEADHDEEENGPIDPATMATTSDNPDDDDQQQQQQQQQHDDMEIAWENLESARLILTRMLSEGTTQPHHHHHHTDQWRAKLRDDLAQCQLRAGDLQRWNAQYEMAILDYEAALDHLAPFQIRKRAEIHYNLASVCLNQVAAATATLSPQKSEEPTEDEVETVKEKIPLTTEQLDQIRFKGFEYFYKCAVDLASVIAESAGISNWSPPIVATATTTTRTIREDLQALRVIVQSWPVPSDNASAIDSVQLLNEIQETVDEAETAETALQEATQLKEQITAAVAAQQQQQQQEDTTNPFGQRSSDADCCAIPTNAFGVATVQTTSAPAAVAQQPITMMIKKKKKQQPETDPTISAQPSSKRPKNE